MKAILVLFGLALVVGCAATDDAAPRPPKLAINEACPRSGKPVAEDSLTVYRGYTVGFCNQHCRDDFAARPGDLGHFDAIIARIAASGER